ncbi:MAG: hypothetical protein WBG57_04200 [Ornithinimicrobium sp.]
MKRITQRTRSAVVIGSAAALLFLSGCSGDESSSDPSEDTEQSEETGASEDEAPATGEPVGEVEAVPELEDSEGARRDARFEDCSLEAGEVTVPGQVTNSQDEDQDYIVSVSWIVEGSQVIARGVTEVTDVPTGETEEFEIDAELETEALECTYNVRRAPSGEEES